MTIEAIMSDLEKANSQLADVRARLIAEKRKHETAIKSIETTLASMPMPKTMKGPTAPAVTKPEEKGPSIGEAVVALVKGQPGATISQIAAGLPALKRKSVENTVSRLTSAGTLVRDGKGYAAA